MGQQATAITRDIIEILGDDTEAKKVLPRKSWAIVNATASLSVREALGSVRPETKIARVIETSLYAEGKVGLITVEGPGRNPDGLDLIAEAYVLASENEPMRTVMFASGDTVTRQTIGEGCGSATMIMSDAGISMFAAPMAEIILRMQAAALPDDGGRILMGSLAGDAISVSWSDNAVKPVISVPVEGDGEWRIRVSARAAEKIVREMEQWPGVETGGIVMGRISEAARTFYVADILPAPDDSQRSADEFVLGTHGVRRMISDYAESCSYNLYCLGTWHNHLIASGASNTDRATAAAVALARLAPSILLIHTLSGFRALLAADASSPGQYGSEAA